jgi:hypothetical protein
MGVGQGGSTGYALLGYPRSRKNGGHSDFRDRSLDSLPYL